MARLFPRIASPQHSETTFQFRFQFDLAKEFKPRLLAGRSAVDYRHSKHD